MKRVSGPSLPSTSSSGWRPTPPAKRPRVRRSDSDIAANGLISLNSNREERLFTIAKESISKSHYKHADNCLLELRCHTFSQPNKRAEAFHLSSLCASHLNHKTDAIVYAQEAISSLGSDNASSDLYYQLALSYMQAGKYGEAYHAACEAVGKLPKNSSHQNRASILNLMAACALRMNKVKEAGSYSVEAIQLFKKSNQVDHSVIECLDTASQACLLLGRHQEAYEFSKTALQRIGSALESRKPHLLATCGISALHLNKNNEAHNALNEAFPTFPEGHQRRGIIRAYLGLSHLRVKQYEQGYDHCEMALPLIPQGHNLLPQVFTWMAQAAWQLGRPEEGLSHLKEAEAGASSSTKLAIEKLRKKIKEGAASPSLDKPLSSANVSVESAAERSKQC